MLGHTAKIVKLGAKIREIVDVVGDVFFVPGSFLQPQPSVIGNLRL